jgi:O-antigen/teichoic acid export membrane protein
VIALVSPLVFGLVFGEEWRDAGLFVSILAPMYYVYFVTNPTGATLDVLERQDLNLIREVIRIGLMAGAVLLAALAHLSPLGGVAVVSVAGCLTYVLYGGLSWRAISDHRRRSLHDAGVIGDVGPPKKDGPEG